MPTIGLKPDGAVESVSVSLERSAKGATDEYTAKISGRRIAVRNESTGEGAGLLHIDGRIVTYHVVRTNGVVHVWIGGRTFRFELIELAARRSKSAAAAMRRSDLTAPMPGTVLKVLVSSGQRFEAHAPLVVMESMKMEMTLSAPHAGQVKEIACRPGQLVAMGAVLMRFEEADDGDAA